MTYNVFGGTLSLPQSSNQSCEWELLNWFSESKIRGQGQGVDWTN